MEIDTNKMITKGQLGGYYLGSPRGWDTIRRHLQRKGLLNILKQMGYKDTDKALEPAMLKIIVEGLRNVFKV